MALWTGNMEAEWVDTGVLNSHIHSGACLVLVFVFTDTTGASTSTYGAFVKTRRDIPSG